MNDIGLVEFIEALKENRCLWDPSDASYTNRTARKSAQTVLLNIVQKYDPNATLTSVRKKIDYLRTIYLRERKKVEASEFETTSNQVYKPILWYYNHLNFLSQAYKDKTVPDSPDSFVQSFLEDDEEERQEILHQPMNDVKDFQIPSLKALKRKRISPQKLLITSSEKIISMPETGLKDSWEAFGISVGGDLRNLEENQQTIAQKLISDVIFFAKMGRLSEGSAAADSPSRFVSSSPFASSIMSPTPPICNNSGPLSPNNHESINLSPPYSSSSSKYSLEKASEPEINNFFSSQQISTNDPSKITTQQRLENIPQELQEFVKES